MSNAIRNKRLDRTVHLYDGHPFGLFSYDQQRLDHNRPLVDFLATVNSESTVYDIGCGAGYWLDQAVAQGIRNNGLMALDLSFSSAMRVRRRGFNVTRGDGLNLPFADNVSDYTISNGVIGHTLDPQRAFGELVRITRPGGRIFLAVYNCYNPYFYLVHRATWPIRFLYWEKSKRTLDFIYPLARLIFQPISRLVFGKYLDENTARTLFMDQVMVPNAALYSKSSIRNYAREHNCRIEQFRFGKGYVLLTAEITVDK